MSELRREDITRDYMGGKSGEHFRKCMRIWEYYEKSPNQYQDFIDKLDSSEMSPSKAYRRIKEIAKLLDPDTENDTDSKIVDVPTKVNQPEVTGKYVFLPVLGKQFVSNARSDGGNTPRGLFGHPLTWWDEKCIIPGRHSWVFLKPLEESVDADHISFKQAYRLDDDVFVMSDSGGYQIMEGDARVVADPQKHSFKHGQIHPVKLTDWQVANADAGILLDVPPFDSDSGRNKNLSHLEFRSTRFKSAKLRSIKYAEIMVNRHCELIDQGVEGAEDFYQLPVIQGDKGQGDPWEFVRDWHTDMKAAIGQPKAWALSAKPNTLDNLATHLTYGIVEFDDAIEHVHFLQQAGARQMMLLEWFSMLTDTLVSSDATSHIAQSSNWKFAPPGRWFADEKFDLREGQLRPLKDAPCRCNVCTIATREWGPNYLSGTTGKQYQARTLHNLTQLLAFNQKMRSLMRYEGLDLIDQLHVGVDDKAEARDDNEFWRRLLNWNESNTVELWKAMRALELADGHGLDAVRQEALLTDKPLYEQPDAMKATW